MPADEPRLDRPSLIRLGFELQANHHRSDKAPLTDRQKDLLLQWAVAEAVNAARDEVAGSERADEGTTGSLRPSEPPGIPQPIASAPKAPEGDRPRALLLYAPRYGGWYTGFWSGGRWRTRLDPDLDLQPTHWLPPMAGPEDGTQGATEVPDPRDWR